MGTRGVFLPWAAGARFGLPTPRLRIDLGPVPVRACVTTFSFPKLEDIPIVSDIYAMYKEKQREKEHLEMQKIGRCVRAYACVCARVHGRVFMPTHVGALTRT